MKGFALAIQILICSTCGTQFKHNVKAYRPRYCSMQCKRAATNARARELRKLAQPGSPVTASMRIVCEGCGVVGIKTTKGLCRLCAKDSRRITKAAYMRQYNGTSEAVPVLTTIVRRIPLARCKACLCDFTPNRGTTTMFCCRECSFDWMKAKATLIGKASVMYRVKRCRCEHCNAPMTSNHGKLICSKSCRIERARLVKVMAYKHTDLICLECTATFTTSYGNSRTVYCSDACCKRSTRRAARKRERAVLRGATVETVNPNVVFDRDGWRCQFCNVRTPRSKRGTYASNAPELDHIMPLSKGGEHSYTNTQCLCRSCNAAKSNKPMGQLSLL